MSTFRDTNVSTADEAAQADALRETMITELGQMEAIRSDPVADAFGMRVLEIGSGGYNTALIAELVGEDGEVTTVDIDPEVTDRARSCLSEAGYSRVNVVLARRRDWRTGARAL